MFFFLSALLSHTLSLDPFFFFKTFLLLEAHETKPTSLLKKRSHSFQTVTASLRLRLASLMKCVTGCRNRLITNLGHARVAELDHDSEVSVL